MTKLLHLADVHLGGVMWGRSRATRSRLREALRTSLVRAVDCALTESVDAVLVAGDLYEQQHLSLKLEQFLIEQFQRLHDADVPVVSVPGASEKDETEFDRSVPVWPPTFHCLEASSPEVVDLSDAAAPVPLRVVGLGFAGQETRQQALFPDEMDESDLPTVGLAYVEGGSEEEAASVGTDALPNQGIAYWALGGVHRRQRVAAEPPVWYSGSMFGRNPSEVGPKGGLLVTLREDAPPDVSFRAFTPLEWKTLRLGELAGVRTRDALRRRVAERLPARHGQLMLRLRLEGHCPLASTLADPSRRRELEGSFADRLGVVAVHLDTSALRPAVELDLERGGPQVLDETLELIDQPEADEKLYPLRPSVLAGCGPEEDRHAYLRQLLQGLRSEMVARMMETGSEPVGEKNAQSF